MCITFFYVNPDPKPGEFSLIVIANRDEFIQRPTEEAKWKDGILAGRDMQPGRGILLVNYVCRMLCKCLGFRLCDPP